MTTRKLSTAWAICALLTILNMVFWIPVAFDLIPQWYSPSKLLARNGVLGTLFYLVPYSPGSSLFYIPFIIAFLFGIYDKKDSYKLIGLAGFLGAVSFGYVSFYDIEYGVEGGFSEYGSWSFLVLSVAVATFAVTLLALAGGYFRGRFDRRRIPRSTNHMQDQAGPG